MAQLTGKFRYRIQRRWYKDPLLVLQVEEKLQGHLTQDPYLGPEYYEWRDAKVEDIIDPTAMFTEYDNGNSF